MNHKYECKECKSFEWHNKRKTGKCEIIIRTIDRAVERIHDQYKIISELFYEMFEFVT